MLSTPVNSTRAGTNFAASVPTIVWELFGRSPNPKQWYALAPLLALLAEAAPDVFLDVVERDVIGDKSVRDSLFQDEGHFGRSRHCHLLWALETIAWSPHHFVRVAVTLAGLAVNDPGGTTTNRPSESLWVLLLPGFRSTAATHQMRLAALSAINRSYPELAFGLVLRLLPSHFGTAMPPERPRWRLWAFDHDYAMLTSQYFQYVAELGVLALNWAGTDDHRLAKLLDRRVNDSQETLQEIISRIEALPLEQIASTCDDILRRMVRQVLHRKQTHNNFYQGLTSELLERLRTIYTRLEPADFIRRDTWLFDQHPHLLSVTGNDWQVEADARERERRDVVKAFINRGETSELLKLAEHVTESWSLVLQLQLLE